jgi:mono/diheme cytochrome c family protein
MSRRLVLNIFLLIVLLGSALANWALRPDLSRPNMEFAPDMAHGPRYNAFAANPNFPDGKTLQREPDTSIPRAFMPLHYAATPEDAARAGNELASPTSQGAASLKRGEFIFENYCATCHGAGGLGNGPVAQRGFPPPPSLLADKTRRMRDGQLFHVLTYGQNNMPSYASQVSREDRWNVIAYVRSLQTVAPLAPAISTPLKGGQ